ncbi:mechanosensitive ion channel family protein [Caldimonas tepidiphila]|uniref:mechanosensitive ion channel family protein n=1 Tax=Caldimonas tepidiphila TaxID=2315841 RepID=UPI001F0B93F8|nr:mechanosensitive ion channel family protein [Caldimonas tepidiphila]
MNADVWNSLLLRWGGLGGVTSTALRVVAILLAAWLAIAVLQRMIRLVRLRLSTHLHDIEAQRRAETLGRALRYIVAVVISALAFMLVLGEMGISLAPILGAAGVVGVAVGFGAQSLVKDYFNGFFLLLENQIRVGDVVRLSERHAGLVEEMTLRYVRLRDYDGHVHYVPNGSISEVINMTHGFAQAVCDVGVAYRENADEVLEVMREVGEAMRAEEAFADRMLDATEIVGVERWDDSAVILRARFKVSAGQQWTVRREYLRRLKAAFDARGIEIPYPHLTLYAGEGKDGSAPAFRTQMVRDPARPTLAANDTPRPERA